MSKLICRKLCILVLGAGCGFAIACRGDADADSASLAAPVSAAFTGATVRGDDRLQNHGKLFAPFLISWQHDAAIRENQAAQFLVTAVALQDFDDTRLRILLPDGLERSGGDFERDFGFVRAGNELSINFRILPRAPGAYSVAVHLAGERDSEPVGVGRAIEFTTAGYDVARRAATERRMQPGGGADGYTVTEGGTDFGAPPDDELLQRRRAR